jgi:hypothetical protein
MNCHAYDGAQVNVHYLYWPGYDSLFEPEPAPFFGLELRKWIYPRTLERKCVLCGAVDRLCKEADDALRAKARKTWPDGPLEYDCAECDAKLQAFRPAPWQTPKAGDACESGSTERQQKGWPSLGREAQRVLTSWS